MLTKGDLEAIGDVVDGRIDKQLTSVEKNIKQIQGDITTIQKDIRVMFAVLDRADMDLRRRVDRIEDHLGLAKVQ